MPCTHHFMHSTYFTVQSGSSYQQEGAFLDSSKLQLSKAYVMQQNLDLRKPDLRKNLDIKNITTSTYSLPLKTYEYPRVQTGLLNLIYWKFVKCFHTSIQLLTPQVGLQCIFFICSCISLGIPCTKVNLYALLSLYTKLCSKNCVKKIRSFVQSFI